MKKRGIFDMIKRVFKEAAESAIQLQLGLVLFFGSLSAIYVYGQKAMLYGIIFSVLGLIILIKILIINPIKKK